MKPFRGKCISTDRCHRSARYFATCMALSFAPRNASAIRTGPFLWGNIFNDVLTFLITAVVVYLFIVVPANRPSGSLEAVGVAAPNDPTMPGMPE